MMNFLFTGDAERQREKHVHQETLEIDVQISDLLFFVFIVIIDMYSK